jgi:hypothetical protein
MVRPGIYWRARRALHLVSLVVVVVLGDVVLVVDVDVEAAVSAVGSEVDAVDADDSVSASEVSTASLLA